MQLITNKIYLLSLLIACFLLPITAKSEVIRELEVLKLGNIEPEIKIELPKPGEKLPSLKNLPYSVPELISFNAYHETFMSRVLGGHCSLAIEKLVKINGKWALKFSLKAKSAEWYDWLIVIKEDINGYFDLATGRTLFLTIDKQEGSYYQTKTVLFDYDNKRVVEKDISDKKITYKQFTLAEDVIDPFSVLFLIRRANLNKVKKIEYKIYSNGKIYELNTKVHGKENITMGGNKYDTNKVEVLTRVEGALEQKKGIFMYYTMGRKQFPLFSDASVKVGHFALEMVSVE